MTETRIKISSLIENQLPQYILEEFPLAQEFLSQYYVSLENQSSVNDILQNIDRYIKVDNLTNLVESTTLTGDVTFFDSTINVESTAGFPESYGILLIDSEIITYKSKTSTTFDGCIRGFIGVTAYKEKKDELTFSETSANEHFASVNGDKTNVVNLSVLFLKEFLIKVKKQFIPGFDDRQLYSDLNEALFIKQSIDFYSSKGTDSSFKILFGALYGEKVDVIKPRDYLIQPSDAQYRITADFVVEYIEGNPEDLVNATLYQDESDFINSAKGTVTKVEKIRRGNKDYYVFSLDYDYDKDIQPVGTIFGQFSIHSKTKLVSSVLSNSETLEVDSTVGFPKENGKLVVDLSNETSLNIEYSTKTLNQFLGCKGISQDIPEFTEIKLDSFAYGYDRDGNQIKIRILGVLSDLKIKENTSLYFKDDTIKIKTLGIDSKDYRANNWFFNVSVKYKVKSVVSKDSPLNGPYYYEINTYDEHAFRIGDTATLLSSNAISIIGEIYSFNNETSFGIVFASKIDENLVYTIKKNVSKSSSEYYPQISKYTANVQNVYLSDDDIYIASPSLPKYKDINILANDRSLVFSGSFSGNVEDPFSGTILTINKDHGFYTGESVVYKPSADNTSGIDTGVYFIKKISNRKLSLARSRSNIFTNNFIEGYGTVTDAKFEILDFNTSNLTTKSLESQKLIRKISTPIFDGSSYKTNPGPIGIFINGVELLNYKSKDNVYYGPIEKIIPIAPGSGYDVINPPILSISDQIGVGATGYCSVIGGLERIDIIDPGFDYLQTPSVNITGGNGYGAKAKVNLVSFDHEVFFNSQSFASAVKLNPTNTIGFTTYHKFRNIEEVVYITNNQTSVGGLSTNSTYFVSVQDQYNIKLYNSASDASIGINTIQLTSYGSGKHILKCKSKKKKIGSITVESSGQNYKNNLTLTGPIGINTALNIITISNHGYNSGEVIVYKPTETVIGGLTSSTSYYVTKIDDDHFRLSNIGIGTLGITTSFYYDTNQYVNLTSKGSGLHKFNYPEIKVTIEGEIGVSTSSGKTYSAVVNPVFRGKINSVFVSSGGSSYGSQEILNYNRQPFFDLVSGSGIQVTPIISSKGQISKIIVNSSGSRYNSPPNIVINGSGSGAILTPIFSNGSLVEIKVIYGGGGYNSTNTSIDVIPAGNGAKFEAQIKSWKINLIEKLKANLQIFEDDGILTSGKYGLEYTHAYAPKPLRLSTQGTKIIDGEKKYFPDLSFINGAETVSDSHSPIIGWAYDGNPIYGPYGYSSKTGGEVKRLTSGYRLLQNSDSNRPSIYKRGFFIEDYEYVGNGDLDEHNGRFCVTPEYPNGVYAYFATIDESFSPFFPYIIGNFYKSKPIEFNFNSLIDQDYIDINDTGWRRNTTPYNILKENSSYEYLLEPNKIKPQNSSIKNTYNGSVDSIGILTGGKNYKVGDRISFKGPFITEAKAKVSLIKGKPVTQVSTSTSSISNITFYPYDQKFIGFSSNPHNLLNNDLITITGKYDYKKSGNIEVRNNVLSLTTGINSTSYTGLVTYFSVAGSLRYPIIKENDIYQIGNEQVKILNVDLDSSRIRILRNYNGTVGLSSYSAGIALTEKTRKFVVNFGISTSYNFDLDKELYFDPNESVGLGTTSGVGIVTTIYFSNPGTGITQITIPTKTIYIKNHNLNTGDSIVYSSNGGTQISVSTDGTSVFQLNDQSILYAAKISNDLIGISTVKVGLGSDGNFISIGATSGNLLYFNSIGSGLIHSFKTNYKNTLTGQISKNVVTVSTAETHGLSLFDKVEVQVKTGVSTTYSVKYNDYNRRLIIDQKSFSSIDIENSIITINNHGYYNGQKVLHTSNSPANGLVNNKIYYVVTIDQNRIKLSESYYGSKKINPETVEITSSSSGNICPINPNIKVLKNQSITFDLSDSSLSFVSSGVTFSAFDFKIYKDSKFNDEFDSSSTSSSFEVLKVGKIGIDTGARVTLNFNEYLPKTLYYNLVPINLDINLESKKEIVTDNEVESNNKIALKMSVYDGNHTIIGISTNTFKFNILNDPEVQSYISGVEYYTNSTQTEGSIEKISILNVGKYQVLPGISSVSSSNGKDAILVVETKNIGKINRTEIEDIGFDYSSDFSVRPIGKLPFILKLETLSTFDYIGITSFGRNYNSTPDLIVIDGVTNEVIKDVYLSYSTGDSLVTIIKNSSSINNVTPKIIPTNNSNGIKIKNITFNDSTKNVTVTLGASFSNAEDYPFEVGSKVLIEGISVGIATTAKGYNSSNYNYELFTLTSVDPNIGGAIGTVTYNLSSYLEDGEIPGTFNSFYSSGKIIPESHFPIFNPVLKKKDFYKGENVYTKSSNGNVESWDPLNQYLKVSSSKDFSINDKLIGNTSGSVGIIKNIINYDVDYSINSFSPRRKGWNTETGFLNADFQRIHDSDYYQYFSYDLRSKKDLNTWNNPVSSLNHTAGFKKFGNVIVESSVLTSGISTDQNKGDFVGIADLSRVIDLNCVPDFDLAQENNLLIDDQIKSDQIFFNSRIIQDYIESIGNRVLIIDDISDQFNSNPRPTEFSIVDTFRLDSVRSKKYIISIQDKKSPNQKQLSIVSLLHNDSLGFLNQYGMQALGNLGFFDFSISGSEGNLLFYPVKYKFNDYHVECFSFALSDVIVGLGTINLGDVCKLNTNTVTIPNGTSSSTTVVGIASTYRSAKVLVQIGSTNSSHYEYNEISYTHDDNVVYSLEYGDINTINTSSRFSSGIGTYNAYLSGGEVKIDLIPSATTDVDYTVNSFIVSIGNTSSSGIGTELLGGSSIDSNIVSIAATSSPISNLISSYDNTTYNCSYHIISVEDKTNSSYQVSEFLTLTNNLENVVYTTEYGLILSDNTLGVTTASISGSNTNLYFTPIEDIEVDVRIFQVNIGISNQNEQLNLL